MAVLGRQRVHDDVLAFFQGGRGTPVLRAHDFDLLVHLRQRERVRSGSEAKAIKRLFTGTNQFGKTFHRLEPELRQNLGGAPWKSRFTHARASLSLDPPTARLSTEIPSYPRRSRNSA